MAIQSATATHPIIFSAPMVRAILDCRKSQTRRVVASDKCDLSKFSKAVCEPRRIRPNKTCSNLWRFYNREECFYRSCPYGAADDHLWVRETWAPMSSFDPSPETGAVYKADDHPSQKAISAKWKPSIHMPRWASRITLEITGVRVERLNEITTFDAEAEGVTLFKEDSRIGNETLYQSEYRRLWESINGQGSWSLNPWVWVIEFKRI